MDDGSSQYKSSTEQERFARQLVRDMERSSNVRRAERGESLRLSQSTIRKLISEDTRNWARAIADQKLASNNSGNIATQANRPTSAEISSTSSPRVDDFQAPQASASSAINRAGSGQQQPDPPTGVDLPTFNATICENGQPVDYEIYGKRIG